MKTKRILSVLIAIVMLSTMLPTVAFTESSIGTATGGLITGTSDFDTVLGAGNYEYSDRTIKILKDLTFNNPLMFEIPSTSFTLDLNGKTLDMIGESVILYKGGLTIIDSGKGGTIKSSGDTVRAISYESDLNITGGTFTSTGYGVAVILDHCNSVISGGTFTGRYAIQRLNDSFDSMEFKLAGSPVLNGSHADIYLENPSNHSSIYYYGYEPADGDGPASIMMGNWPDSQYGRVVINWDNDKTLSDYFKYAGNGSQNDPFIVVDPYYEHYVVAEKPYDAWIGTTRITRLNQDDVFGDGTVSFTSTSTNILVLNLNNFSYEGSAHSSTRGIIDIENYPYENYHSGYHVSVNITGANTIVAKNTPAYGIVTDSYFSLNGSGSLNISGCQYGMYITDANNWQLTKEANSVIPTLEITSTVATSNKSMYLYPNDKEYKLTLGTQAPVRNAGGKNIAIENVKYFKVEEAPLKPVISIATQPAASTKVTEGKISGTLTVAGSVANGSSASLNYQWYSNTVNANFNGTPIDGATSSSFTIPENLAPGTYYYYCSLSMDDANPVRSNAATVVVEAEVIIPTHTHSCGHDECDGAWENFVVIDGNIGSTTNPRLTGGNTYYFVLGDNMSSRGFNPSISSGTATVYLCLNGHSINDITIPVGVTMYVCDCADEPGIVSARFNVYGTAMLGSGRYPLLRQMGDTAAVHVYGPITMGDQADFSSARNKTITLDNEDAKITFSAKPYMTIKFIPYGPGVFATGWESSCNYMPVSANDAYEVVYNRATGELSFVEKAAQSAPETPAAVGETIKGKNDGKITGVTDAMEYKKQGDTDYIAITGTEIADLAAGTYLVRYKETDGYLASPDKQLVIADGALITVTFASNGGSVVDSQSCEYNQTITAPDAPTKEGFEFIAWYADDTLITKWDFANTITETKTLYAKWVQGAVSDHEDHVDEVEAEGLNDIAKAEETDIKLVVQTEPITEGDTEQTAIKGITDAPDNFIFYDITLEKSTGGYVTDASSVIEIKLPYDFSRKTNIKVYRYHDSVPEEFTQLEARATAPFSDGKCFVDTANGCIYIYSSKFSTYAIAYDTVGLDNDVPLILYSFCTVDFRSNGGSTLSSKTVTKYTVLQEPAEPKKGGYIFKGWFEDEALTKAYDFDSKVTKNFTLYAKWEKVDDEKEENPDTHVCPSKSYDDLDVTLWYHLDVDYVIENGLMKGTDTRTFAPNGNLTRAMLVTVLYRLEGEPSVNNSIPFSDVDMGAYYANAVSWAKQNGIVNGVTETEFAPNDNITREQIAAIMYRYAQYKGIDALTPEENLHFADSSEISEYAVSAVNWAVGTGLINGKSESILAPKDNATRAEVAAILHRFIKANLISTQN